MKKHTIVADRFLSCVRLALIENDEIRELRYHDLSIKEKTGAIYLARVERVLPSLNAAFVNIGADRSAFLPLEHRTVSAGDRIIVQGFANQTNPDKAFRVSLQIQVKGRRLIMKPDSPHAVALSAKIRSKAERERLTNIVQPWLSGCEGVIVRTSAQGAGAEDLEREWQFLKKEWTALQTSVRGKAAPCIVMDYDYSDEILNLYGSDESACIVTNDGDCAEKFIRAQKCGMLHEKAVVTFWDHQEKTLSEAYALVRAEDRAMRRQIWLPCGGYLIVDYCEAMTVYDVNSGKYSAETGETEEEAAFRINQEAVCAVLRHVRLCDTGGIIVIDLIDMKDEAHRKAVIHRAKAISEEDRAQTDIYDVTRLGLLEITRKRSGISGRFMLRTNCPTCGGSGSILSEAVARMRRAKADARDGCEGLLDAGAASSHHE